jgi:phosphate transport system substrate-binding protein
MKKLLLASLLIVGFMTTAHAQLKGSGSTFAAELYTAWGQALAKNGVEKLDYEPTGSTAGVRAAVDRSADFGASDTPLSRAELDQAGLVQFPTAIGGVVILANVPGVAADKIKLDGATLAGIYLGRIKQWSDPAIKALNPDVKFPAQAIVPIFRDAGSGTTSVFTSYLSKVSPEFKAAVGVTSTIKIPFGKGGKTSSEMTKLLQSTSGSVSYLDFANASDLGLPTVELKNQWGKFVAATPEALQLSMRAADWEKLQIDQNPTFAMDLTNAECPGCWPIANATYVLVPAKGRSDKSLRVLDFFNQALLQGDASASKEGYVPLPSRAKSTITLSMRRWYTALGRASGPKI